MSCENQHGGQTQAWFTLHTNICAHCLLLLMYSHTSSMVALMIIGMSDLTCYDAECDGHFHVIAAHYLDMCSEWGWTEVFKGNEIHSCRYCPTVLELNWSSSPCNLIQLSFMFLTHTHTHTHTDNSSICCVYILCFKWSWNVRWEESSWMWTSK